jgi:hypothetical protein
LDTSKENTKDTRLEGWGEIAAYLRRDIRTLQRWEKLYPEFPIHRGAGPRPRVWALPHELDEWWRTQDVADKTSSGAEVSRQPAPVPRVKVSLPPQMLTTAAVIGILCCAVVAVLSRVSVPSQARLLPDRIFARVDSELGSTAFIPLPGHPVRMAFSSARDEIYILGSDKRNEVQVFDVGRQRLLDPIPVPGDPRSIAVANDGREVYVGTHSGDLQVVDRINKTSRIAADKSPADIRDLALTADGKHLYMAIYRAGLRRYDVDTGRITVLSTTGCAESLALDDAHRRLFIGYKCGGIGGSIAHDTVDMLDLASGERSRVFAGPPMVAGPLFLFPSRDKVWVDGQDACENPYYSKYDLTGCPGYPATIHHIFRISDHLLVKTLGAVEPSFLGLPTFTPDGNRIVAGGRPVHVFETGAYAEIETFERDNLLFSAPPVFDLKRNRLYLATIDPGRLYPIELPASDCDYPSQNLQYYWTGDGTFNDRTGRVLTATDDVTFAPGLIGRCFRLRNSTLAFETAYGFLTDFVSGEGTLQAWVKFDIPTRESSLFDLSVNGTAKWRLTQGPDRIAVFREGMSPVTVHHVIKKGWHHIAVVSRVSRLEVVVDGVAVAQAELPKTGPGRTRLTIGPMDALVDEIGIHDRAFAIEELLNLYRRSRTCVSATKN